MRRKLVAIRVLDRLLMGVAVSDDDLDLAPGEIAPLAVEGDEIAVAGRLADLVARLEAIADDMTRPRTAAAWCEALSRAIEQLFEVDATQSWQLDHLRRMLAEISDHAVVGGKPATVEIALADVRRILAERIKEPSRRPDFFRGGITISSLTPLRWLPFRVICILGLDEANTSPVSGSGDGDDLAAAAPLVGDRDPRSETRQALLEAVLNARDHLVVTRTGHNIRTNQEVPNATVLAELRATRSSPRSPPTAGEGTGAGSRPSTRCSALTTAVSGRLCSAAVRVRGASTRTRSPAPVPARSAPARAVLSSKVRSDRRRTTTA